jgi:Pro-kumamolisin, activation domain/Subtilase family/Divergent InlB B-repeat domain
MRRLWLYRCASVSSSPILTQRRLRLICGPLLLCSFLLFPRYGVSEQRIAIDQTPLAVRNGAARLVAHYEPTKMLRLVLALRPPRMQEEEEFLRQLQDPDSPLFHQYLSEQEWNARFAPSSEDEQAVVAWAQGQGLTITQRYPDRLMVDVEAPSAVIEQALDVTINSYQIGEALYFSNDRDPSIPASLGNVVHSVLGLNSIEVMRSSSSFSGKTSSKPAPDYTPGPAYALGPHREGAGDPAKLQAAGKTQRDLTSYGIYEPYSPKHIYSSYAYDYQALQGLGHCCNPLNHPNSSPPESSIAIAIWGDFDDQDLDGFLFTYNYLAHNVQRYFIDGRASCCEPETTLDVEWATATANSFNTPGTTAEVHVYEGVRNSVSVMLDVVNRALSDGHARILSMSWGGAENYDISPSMIDSYHAVFNQMIGQGWTIVAASGDGGPTTDCDDYLAVNYPATDPDVTAVGGTALDTTTQGYTSEKGWGGGPYGCSNNDGGSGGGCSVHFSAPSYQGSAACGGEKRSVPDIALNADGVNDPQHFYFDGSMQETGGTSIATPEMAGFFAQENAYLIYLQSLIGSTCGPSMSAPCVPIGSSNPYLYNEARHRTAPHYPFYDIASGCNNNDITREYGLSFSCAGQGYDRVTGWGSANMLQLAWTINYLLADDARGPSIAISGPPANQWYNQDQSLSWTLTDTTGNGHQATGAAGSSFAWDADPGDPYRETTPGSGSSYYGPHYFGATGYAHGLNQLSQGCHTAFVRGWDNTGRSQLSTYGPLCYDNTLPVSHIAAMGDRESSGHYIGPVQITLTATDTGSGVANIFFQLGGDGPWQTYTGSFILYQPELYVLLAYSVDRAGNDGDIAVRDVVIDSNTKYLFQISKSGSGTGTVTSADGAINCGSTCSANYWDEQPVTLTATPDPGFVFAGWRGCDISLGYSCTFTMTADRQAYAVFNVPVALQYIPVTPCRVADTRWTNGPFGGPSLAAGISRDITIPQGGCNIPSSAAAYSLNLTAIPHGGLGFLTVWQTGYDRPWISTMNSYDARVKANAAIVPAGDNGAISVYASDAADLALDIDGYFVVAPDPSALAFYPMAPCRVADTRWTDGPLGGPSLPAQQQRDLPVLSSQCGIPATAQAYAMNFTAIPRNGDPLWLFNAWPAGQLQPATSTLNDPTGTAVANAAIVPAGANGDIDVWANSSTDLVIDINGYFAPPGQGGLSLYANVPCRVLDTRSTTGPFNGELTVNVAAGDCGVPQNAQAMVFNTTVVPSGPLWLLALWPDGGAQPNASVLNAWDSAVTSNMAVVMTSNGSIDAYAAGLTQLILDISSYFAP